MVNRRHNSRAANTAGFTLIELIVVMLIIGVLAAIAIPAYTAQIKRSKEAVLKEDLHVMRQAIDQYTVDKQKAPTSLDDLVSAGYLKVIPTDPFTSRTDTWVTEQTDSYRSVDETDTGTIDVHSGAGGLSTENNSYSTW